MAKPQSLTEQSSVDGNIRAEMARRGKTQNDVAVWLGMTRQAVSRRFNGAVAWRLDELRKISDALEVPLVDLIGDAA